MSNLGQNDAICVSDSCSQRVLLQNNCYLLFCNFVYKYISYIVLILVSKILFILPLKTSPFLKLISNDGIHIPIAGLLLIN
jgi:hypothetical protein